jgi:two-component system, LytTR family, sensor kinase
MIPPCALQILVENAVKHNEFSTAHPMKIDISTNGTCLKVSNNLRQKGYPVSSTKIGLNNLRLRYKLVSNKDIEIENDATTYLVKLPLISNY